MTEGYCMFGIVSNNSVCVYYRSNELVDETEAEELEYKYVYEVSIIVFISHVCIFECITFISSLSIF